MLKDRFLSGTEEIEEYFMDDEHSEDEIDGAGACIIFLTICTNI